MDRLLTDYRLEFREELLQLLWRQWTALGVAGQMSPWRRTPLDPEALLAISCTAARHDVRLFDAILDWLVINGRYLNAQRMRRILAEQRSAGRIVYAAIAATMAGMTPSPKWARSTDQPGGSAAAQEPLFFLSDGAPLPILHAPDPTFQAYGLLRERYEPRGSAQQFRPEPQACLLLSLRALLGVNARCEILTYLLLNDRGSPRAVASAYGYSPATIIKAMAEMADSGYLVSRVQGRHRFYSLVPDAWRGLLLQWEQPRWIGWPALYGALEHTWLFLNARERREQPPLAQASALRRVMRSTILDNLARSNLPFVFGDDASYPGESLVPFFVDRMRQALSAVHSLGQSP